MVQMGGVAKAEGRRKQAAFGIAPIDQWAHVVKCQEIFEIHGTVRRQQLVALA